MTTTSHPVVPTHRPDAGTISGGVEFDIDEFGYVVGGGLEWAASESWSVRVEGLYYGFGDEENIDGATSIASPTASARLCRCAASRRRWWWHSTTQARCTRRFGQ